MHVLARQAENSLLPLLLNLGADIDARDRQFRSPLHLACRADFRSDNVGEESAVETLQLLLKKGARVTARDNFGFTALHHAGDN